MQSIAPILNVTVYSDHIVTLRQTALEVGLRGSQLEIMRNKYAMPQAFQIGRVMNYAVFGLKLIPTRTLKAS